MIYSIISKNGVYLVINCDKYAASVKFRVFLLSIIIKSFFIVDTFIARTFKFKKYRPTLDEIQCRNAISR